MVEIQNLYKVYVSNGAPLLSLRNINLEIHEGEFITLVGPSGCGKSTLLNMVAGIIGATHGDIKYKGSIIRPGEVPDGIGYVAQDDYLLPWRDLLNNVILGLEYRRMSTSQAKEKSIGLLQQVGLAGFEGYYPPQLSGGMRKRANIVRTLLCDPSLILMDEPFGPLDAQTRTLLQDQLLQLWQDSCKTVIFVTHDLVEAIALSDRVVVLTRSPGTVKSIHPVRISRPRNVFKIHSYPEFPPLYQRLWDEIQEELQSGLL